MMKLYPHISLYFLIWLCLILFISYFGFFTLPHSGNFSKDFFQSFSNWDGGHFLGIAEFGYSQDFQYAFFPLYPLLIKLMENLTQNYFWSAILISTVSSFLGVQILYKLIILEFNKKIAEKVVLALLIFPTSFYFITTYSESLFFLLVVCTFYFLKTKKLFLATLFAALSSATRVVGLVLVLGLLVEVISSSGVNKKNWYVFLAPFGFLLYNTFLYFQAGDPFYFISAQLHWQRNISIPTASFWETIKSLSSGVLISNKFNALVDLMFAVFGLGLGIRAFRFLKPSYSVYFLASVLLPLFTPTLSSMPRFLLPIFPIFILLSFIRNKFLIFGYQLISVMLLSLFIILFVNGYWVS